jgi:hypothetical protein
MSAKRMLGRERDLLLEPLGFGDVLRGCLKGGV